MAKRVYFAFHYQDVIDFRANVVRNHWVTKGHRDAAGFFDASLWESAKKQGDVALKRLINGGLENTSVTCVLIGSQTFNRRWVTYEIMKSFKRRNSIFAVHINSIAGKDQKMKTLGPNPLEYLGVTFSDSGLTATLYEQIDGMWAEYTDVDGCASYQTGGVANEYRGQGFHFGQLFSTYDWVADNGYDSFSSWVS
ncbi:MAG: TIR domain-containing protein [Bryobacteraceae bacterium]|nr:TIR domain-containing protein [Bryobacteraceae bacterium]